MSGSKTARGFTLIELIVTMIILGILAFVALPNLSSSTVFREAALRDQVAATLRYAQKAAVSHRRLVCASVAGDQLTLSIATAFGDANCATALPGPDGKQPAARSEYSGITLIASATPLYFQPSGAVSGDGAGSAPADFSLTVSNQPPVLVSGATGYVQ